MAKPDSQWYRLDNAGILYSALQREEYSAIYRFSALMTEPVRPAALQNAIDRVLPRFPSFAVRIRRGLFWYYLEPNTAPGPFLKADVANPCQPVRFREDNGWLIRFSACPILDPAGNLTEFGIDPSEGCKVDISPYDTANGIDPILDKGIEVLKSMINNK